MFVPRGNRVRRVALGMVLAMLTAVPAAEASVTPANDHIGHAIRVGSLPFTAPFDTGAATRSTGDVDCTGAHDGHTIWYEFTPKRDMTLGFAESPSGTSPLADGIVMIASGAPGALTALDCEYGTASAAVTAGTTYWLQLSSCCRGPGGTGSLRVQRVTPFAATLEIDPVATVDRAGNLTVTAALACSSDQLVGVEVYGTATEVEGPMQAVGSLYAELDLLPCSQTPVIVTATAQSQNGIGFRKGTVVISPYMEVYNAWTQARSTYADTTVTATRSTP